MAATAAALLDELMGRNRNLAPSESRHELHWDDSEVCKYYLCGFCPHELFTNTRADLGPCDKIHDDAFKDNYEKSSRHEKMGYEEDFIRFLQTLVADVEKRIKRGEARLTLNNTQSGLIGAPQAAKQEKIQMLTEKINELVEQAEELGCEGKVEEAQGVMKLCEQLKEERTEMEADLPHNMAAPKEMEVCKICGAFLVVGDSQSRYEEHLLGKQHLGYDKVRKSIEELQTKIDQSSKTSKDMDICRVCGAFLVVGDAQQRMDEHIMGKQHMGYARILAYIEEHKKKIYGEELERESRLQKEREERDKERENEREKRRKEEKEREDKRRRSRSRSHKRSRSRSRDRRRRSRSRDKDRRRKSRSRDRSRERRRRRSRSKSRERKRSRGRRSRSRSPASRSNHSRDKDKNRDRDRIRDRERDRHHDRDRDRDGRDHHRDKDRGRDRDRERTKDKERSRDKDRDGSRDKSKDSHDDRKKRSKSREVSPEKESTSKNHNGDDKHGVSCNDVEMRSPEKGDSN